MATGIDMIPRAAASRRGNAAADARRNDDVSLDPAHLTANGIFALNHLDPRARSFILLRSQLLNGFYASGGRSIAISSTQPGNGKTFVTTNLAVALSKVHPAILIDLDLSQPTLCERMGLAPAAGIDDYLAGEIPLDRAVCKVPELDLAILPVRQRRLHSAALLSGDRLGEIFSWASGRAENPVCIIDTPPTVAIDDMLSIARHVDGILMVIEEGQTRQDELREAIRLLEPTPIIGTVLNKSIAGIFRKRSRKYYYYSRILSEQAE